MPQCHCFNHIRPILTKFFASKSEFSPTAQRLYIGGSALIFATYIDSTNPFVDEDTRNSSVFRTAVKSVVFTCSGLISRAVGQKFGMKYAVKHNLKDLAGPIANVFSVIGGVVSVFLIDVPVLNNYVNEGLKKYIPRSPGKGNKVSNPQVMFRA